MFYIERAFRAQGRQVGAADVCVQRRERLSENSFIRRATRRGRNRQPHDAELTATRRGTGNGLRAVDPAPRLWKTRRWFPRFNPLFARLESMP